MPTLDNKGTTGLSKTRTQSACDTTKLVQDPIRSKTGESPRHSSVRQSRTSPIFRADSSPRLLSGGSKLKSGNDSKDLDFSDFRQQFSDVRTGSSKKKGTNVLPTTTTDEDSQDDNSDDQEEFRILTKSQSEVHTRSAQLKKETKDSELPKSNFSSGGFDNDLEEEKQMLLNVEQNIANLEKSMSMQEKIASMAKGHKSKDSSPETPRKR